METIALRMGPVPISHIFGRHAINIHRNLLGAAIGLGYYEHTISRFSAPQVSNYIFLALILIFILPLGSCRNFYIKCQYSTLNR